MRINASGLVATLVMALVLSGCASQANKDPLEGFNRGVYKFNDTADKAVIKPIAGAYKAVLPSPIRTGVNNFFSNLGTVVTAVNNLLQFKFDRAMDDLGRVVINSTVGVLGLIDVASMDGIPKHSEDFGQTLGHWGVGSGAYIVLPFIGPSTLRDTAGFAVDTALFDPIGYVDHVATRNQARVVKFIDLRAQYLPASDLLDDAALDPYAFMRDAYLQRRQNQINDGVAGARDDDDEYGEDLPAEKAKEPAPAASSPASSSPAASSEAPSSAAANETSPSAVEATEHAATARVPAEEQAVIVEEPKAETTAEQTTSNQKTSQETSKQETTATEMTVATASSN
ncbi:VacJ family lipoprotein [Pseudomethylobacillus aquaticus]|uniref:VacJ family lipoprotein n=1 Tax=Pseudomethylobacillus aquaticus TaxID=2676064 RepID=A0A3N0UY94_9PROT|nr:VacJ family lipoprotein [Pseudomethylobacillus aquaticus]ROH85433.1 VacJ family lipoprotein [Pseudomethylobacillus aquaticus]